MGERKYLICIAERSIWMKNRLGGIGLKSESKKAVRRHRKDSSQGMA